MERKNFAVLCAAVLCFWLFALALGTAEGVGLRAVMQRVYADALANSRARSALVSAKATS